MLVRLLSGLAVLSGLLGVWPSPSVHAEPTATEPPEILVSRQLMEARGLETGSIVLLSANADGVAPRPFRIAAAYEPVPNPFILGAKRLGLAQVRHSEPKPKRQPVAA